MRALRVLYLVVALSMLLFSCSPDDADISASSEISETSEFSDPGESGCESESENKEYSLSGLSEFNSLMETIPRDGSATVIFEENIDFPLGTIIAFPLKLVFLGDVGGSLTVATDLEATVYVAVSGEYEQGAITVNAPFCSLSWRGKSAPMALDVALYMNVRDYNGFPMSEFGYGGTGTATVGKFESCGLDWTVDGNVIFAQYGYSFDENDLKEAPFSAETDGTVLYSGEKLDIYDGNATLTVSDGDGKTRTYAVKAMRENRSLPVVDIKIADGAEVTDRDRELEATFTLTDNGKTVKGDITVKGRGHSSWRWQKKPYKIEFSEKASLFGLKKAKDWVLLANYPDKSLIRNTLAFALARTLNFDYVPTSTPVDLFINGTYRGVYSLGEQIEVREGRVELSYGETPESTGYLVEIGGADPDIDEENADWFGGGYVRYAKVIYPRADDRTQEQFDYIKSFVLDADNAVQKLDGYDEYIDIDSLIDWVILTELSYNSDGAMRRSCFLTLDAGGKLKFGPPWDFDHAFGNLSKDNLSYDDLVTVGTSDGYVAETWVNFLIGDEEFLSRLTARWNEVKDGLKSTANAVIDEYGALVSASQEDNYALWNTWDIRAGQQPLLMLRYNTYEKQLQYLRDFIERRIRKIDNLLN